jgi:hypothetical protein
MVVHDEDIGFCGCENSVNPNNARVIQLNNEVESLLEQYRILGTAIHRFGRVINSSGNMNSFADA